MRTCIIAFLVLIIGVVCTSSSASVTMITNKQQWLTLVGPHEFIGFTGYPHNTLITTQYQSQGVEFPDGDDFIQVSGSYPSDGAGLRSAAPFGQYGSIQMSFDVPRFAVAFEFIGFFEVHLYHQATHLYTSGQFHGDDVPFIGFLSTEPFDVAVARDFNDIVVAMDNLYIGAAVPAPGTLGALLSAALVSLTQRRRA